MWRLIKAICCALLGVLLACSPSNASLTYATGQTEDGIGYVVVSGSFEFSDNLNEFSRAVARNAASVVIFDSPGGNIAKSMELGRLIRSSGLATLQPRAFECASACAFAFFGGVQRWAEPGSIGVHRSSFAGQLDLTADSAIAQIQEMTAHVISYLVDMGIDPALLELALKYGSDDIRYLSRSEMVRYRIIRDDDSPDVAAVKPSPTAAPSPKTRHVRVPSRLPRALTGVVRHPKGYATLVARPDPRSTILAQLPNRAGVKILGDEDRWYRVRTRGRVGYLHHTWVKVDQFVSGTFEGRHIQIQSFKDPERAQAFIQSSTLPLAGYVATNGWIAITLARIYALQDAAETLRLLKERGSIPEDSFVTYGNTYVAKVCCDQ